jgi:hypothetical protein
VAVSFLGGGGCLLCCIMVQRTVVSHRYKVFTVKLCLSLFFTVFRKISKYMCA